MPEEIRKKNREVFEFAPLGDYSLARRISIRALDLVFYILISLIGKTIRFETEGWKNFEQIASSGKIPIYAFWHNRIFLATYFFRNRDIVVITSQSFDGEYIARSGDVWSPQIPNDEPLRIECRHFVEQVLNGGRPRSDGPAGLRVVRVLEALQESLDASSLTRAGATAMPG